MRKYPQDQYESVDQIPSYAKNRSYQEKSRSSYVRIAPNLKQKHLFDQPNWANKSKRNEATPLDLVPNYEQPALPYYVVPVLYVPQKVLSNEKMLPSNSFQNRNGSPFASCVRQTKQQRRVMLEDYEIPFITCNRDSRAIFNYQRDPYEVLYPDLNKYNLDDGDYYEETMTEVEDEEEEDEVEEVNDEIGSIVSGASDREEELDIEEPVIYEKGYDITSVTSQGARKYYQSDQEYFCSRPKQPMQVLDPSQNYQHKPNYTSLSPVNYGGDVSRPRAYRNFHLEQAAHPVKLNECAFHDPYYYENYQMDNFTEKPGDFKAKTNYTLMQRYDVNRALCGKFHDAWPSTEHDLKLKSEKKLTCEDILRNYMQEKQISLESLRKTESVLSDATTSTRRSSRSFHTPPCKESPSNQTNIIEAGAPIKLESQSDIGSSNNLRTIDTDKMNDDNIKFSYNENPHGARSSTLLTPFENGNNKQEETDSALASFVKTLSVTVVTAKTSSESSTLKKIPSLRETGAKIEERELYAITVTSQSILDTKSTQTLRSAVGITTSSASTQTEEKIATPDEKEVDLGKLLRNKESNKTLPDIDIFKPLTKPRDLSPSTFFQKFRKQSKLSAGVDYVKEKKVKSELSQQRLAAVASSSRSPPKPSTGNSFKLKKVKKKS